MKLKRLSDQLFTNSDDFEAFKEILETLDHITPVQIPRAEYTEKLQIGNQGMLAETGEDKFGKRYTLYLPDDVRDGELLNIINFLHQTFHLEKNGVSLDSLISQVKLALLADFNKIYISIKDKQGRDKKQAKENAEKEFSTRIEELLSTYAISPDLKQRIMEHKLSFTEKKNFVKKFHVPGKAPMKDSEKNKEFYDERKIKSELSSALRGELDLTFFRKGLDLVRFGMETMSQAEKDVIVAYCEEHKFTKKEYKSWVIEYTKKGFNGKNENYTIRQHHLAIETQKLREEIEIDQLKSRLEKARAAAEDGNEDKKRELAKLEHYAANVVLAALYRYPYQRTNNDFGYQLSKIIASKELYCVGFSLLGHAFLSELGIQHKGLDTINHSALEVIIPKFEHWTWVPYSYLFDGAISGIIEMPSIRRWRLIGEAKQYREVRVEGMEWMYEKRAFAGNPEEILFAHICNNKGTTLKAGANFCYSRGLEHDEQNITLHTNRRHNSSKSEVNNHCQQIIHLNPDDETGYLHLGIDLANSGKPKKALQYLNIALEKNPKNSKIWEVLGHIHLNTKKYKKALDAYEKAIELDPDEPDSREIKGDIWQNLWKQKIAISEYEKALVCRDKMIELHPNDARGYGGKARILYKLQRYAEAITVYDAAIALDPNNAEYAEKKQKAEKRLKNTQKRWGFLDF